MPHLLSYRIVAFLFLILGSSRLLSLESDISTSAISVTIYDYPNENFSDDSNEFSNDDQNSSTLPNEESLKNSVSVPNSCSSDNEVKNLTDAPVKSHHESDFSISNPKSDISLNPPVSGNPVKESVHLQVQQPVKEVPLTDPAVNYVGYINLEDRSQDFVLESKQIFIKEYPTAFNPTIVRWRGELLMCFRTYDPVTKSTDNIGMVWLDEDFELKSDPEIIEVPVFPSGMVSKKQDPRLIVVGDKLYMVLNNSIKGAVSPEVRRMFLTEIHIDGDKFYADPLEPLFNFQGEKEQRWEKNWTPFVYEGELLLAYSLFPHRILRPLPPPQSCEEFGLSSSSFKWDWGPIRGGTQAYLDGDKYLGFFHSSINIATVHSKGKIMPHYVMGAYLFSKGPPFKITHVSPEPIIGKGFYTGPSYKTWKPLRVVFPGGFIFDENYVWVVYGKQDHEIWMVKFDKKKLIDSLLPIYYTQYNAE